MIFTIGCEIELGVMYGGQPVTLPDIPYTKRTPLRVHDQLYHKDAAFLEAAMRPCSTSAEHDTAFKEAMTQLKGMLEPGESLSPRPALKYTDQELAFDPYASEMGCSPSKNIHGPQPRVSEYADNWRYGGAHVNVGYPKAFDRRNVVLALDAVLGLYSVACWEQQHKADIVRRRAVYGRAGEYRVRPFGVEYRTLPNCALTQCKGDELFPLVQKALHLSCNIDDLLTYAPAIAEAINTCDATLALNVFHDAGLTEL